MGRPPAPPAPTVVMPNTTTPQTFQTLAPQESYQDMAESMKRIETETAKIQQQRYDEVGTPAEIGARQKGRDWQTAASYFSSLPTKDPDQRFRPTRDAFARTQKGEHSAKWGQGGVAMPQGAQTGSRSESSSTGRRGSKYDVARYAASERVSNAREAYKAALEHAKKTGRPTGTISDTPSWAKRSTDIFKPEAPTG